MFGVLKVRWLLVGLASLIVLTGCPGAQPLPDGGSPDAGDAGFDAGDGTITLDVKSIFPPGTVVRDRYSGGSITVGEGGEIRLRPDAGVVLLEKAGAAPSRFSWEGSTVYFVITDRFNNGDPTNDNSYGRKKDGDQEIGTWHGGDLKGLTEKLDYLASLGVGAIWLSAPVEQVHGWANGGGSSFKHYGYHGYWALDFTQLDQNLGTSAELTALVDGAHQRGIRVLLDVVLNHPGYATGADLVEYLPEVFNDGTGAAFKAFNSPDLNKWHSLVNYGSTHWSKWWTPLWIRAQLGTSGQFDPPGSGDLTSSLTSLPDFKTEATANADAPLFWSRKPDAGMTLIPNATVRTHLVTWHADWVRKYGIDGFRCDTAKNVEVAAWKQLKDAATLALHEWKVANPTKKLDDAPFWMTGEVYGHGVGKDTYYTQGGFDSLLNFDLQSRLASMLGDKPTLADNADQLEEIYAGNATLIGQDPTFGVLNYLSSHDTSLFLSSVGSDGNKMRQGLTGLAFAPGAAQLFYGDESGRGVGPSTGDSIQGTRSDMNWSSTDTTTLAHAQKLVTFRRDHASIGAGRHIRLPSPPGMYAFIRQLGTEDAVVVVLTTLK